MKPFNPEKAMAGHPVVTRGGHKVRVLCVDRNNDKYPVVAMVIEDDGIELYPDTFTINGRLRHGDIECQYDLFMENMEKEGYVVFYHKDGGIINGFSRIFRCLEDAEKHRDAGNYTVPPVIAKVTWEE